jgi:hypothetical protein
MARLSTRCAAIGWSAAALRHNIARVMATDTALVLSAISRARPGRIEQFARLVQRSDEAAAQSFLGIEHAAGHGPFQRLGQPHDARQEPARRRFGHDAAPRETRPKRAVLDASRMSIGNCMVTPTPTAAPFTAAMIGFFDR